MKTTIFRDILNDQLFYKSTVVPKEDYLFSSHERNDQKNLNSLNDTIIFHSADPSDPLCDYILLAGGKQIKGEFN